MSYKRKITYRTGLFDLANLNSIDKIVDSLSQFEAVLNEDNYVQALDDLLDNTQIVELILSGMSDIPLNTWIVNHFPTTHDLFVPSFENKLLCKLSNFYYFNTSPDDVDYKVICDHYRTVNFAPKALQALFAMTPLEDEGHPANADKFGLSSFKKVKANGPKPRKMKKPPVHEVDTKPLVDLNIAIPRTSPDAQAALTTFLGRLKDILEFYLNKMLSPQIANSVKEGFIPHERPTELKITTDSRLPADTPQADTPVPAVPTTENLPVFQPINFELFFNSPKGFGEWRMLVSQAAHSSLRHFRRNSKKSFDAIKKKIKEISNGHFSEDNQKRINGTSSTDIPVFEAQLKGINLHLVYIVDCDNATASQVLRLFGIFTDAQTNNRLWEAVGRALAKRGEKYIERCIKRVPATNCGDNVFSPARFSPLEMVDSPFPDAPDLPEEDSSNELHKIITLEKYIIISKELLDSIEAGRDDAFPFEVSQMERSIIAHPHSCYVLGRSGTGKTTTMLFKMLWIERAYSTSGEGLARPRQVFVTQSRVLVGKVEEHFFKYLKSLAAGSSEHQNAYERINNRVVNDGFLVDEDDNGEWRNDLPQRYSGLEDHHFPLFITFDLLCTMLEADIRYKEENEVASSQTLTQTLPMMSGPASALRTRGKLVNFDRFWSEYWPHFSQSLTKKLNALSVFSEIMGVISGSEQAVMSESGYLDRDTYENFSLRGQSTFADHRPRIYDIFLSYRKRKISLGDFDVAERTHTILRSFAGAPLMGKKFDHLYVDETQDNLLIDILLLRSLCRNPNGLFWAGDTAQTISAGSSFRFDELKAFLYRIEKRNHLIKPNKLLGPLQRPLTFQLATNYRSHTGIVNCAHTVINLITRLWPNSIDKLQREKGVANGVKPIFYVDVDSDFIKEGRFLSRSTSREKIELGADQCILVRNDKAKKLLEDEIGKVGLILTIYQSKGLEFNDVFLYNFFHDSECDASLWRVVQDGTYSTHTDGRPIFDPIKYIGICSELKSLYVAITRARNNLRIADFSTKGESMRELWLSLGQIQNCLPGNEFSDFAAPSSKEDWEKRAKEFFNLKQYALARDSFMKASNLRSAAIANAYVRQDIAQKIPNHLGNIRTRTAAFESAAQAFLVCARDALKGGSVTYKRYYRNAAECLEEAGNVIQAAENYRIAEDFTKAVLLFRKLGKFEDVYDIITNYGDKVAPEVLESVKDVTRLSYLTEKKFGVAHSLFVTVEEEISYLRDRNLNDALLDLLILNERKYEAAEVHLSKGRFLEAIDLFLEDSENKQDSIQGAVNCILQGLRKAVPFGGSVAGLEVTELLKRSDLIDPRIVSQDILGEIDMFRAISSGCNQDFIRRANSFLSSGNTDAALLCLDRQFEHTPDFTRMDIFEMACALQLFLRYAEMLHDLAFSVDPCTESRISSLFGYRPHEQGTFWIPAGTLLYAQVPVGSCGSASETGLILSGQDLRTVFQECLRRRLLDRVATENDKCRKAPALVPCSCHVVYAGCNRSLCNGAHIFPDKDWFSTWTRVHLLQIQIYHTIIHLQFKSEMKAQQRYWIGKLQQVLNPSDFRFGSYSNMDNQTIAGARKPLNVVIEWVREVAVSLEDYWPPQLSFLTHAMVTANIAFTFDRNEASVYLYRSEFINSVDCPHQYFRRPYGENSLQEFLVALHEKGPSSIVNGILFIRQVMEAKIPVEIGVFCSFIERICASLIVCNMYRRTGSLHGVTLPRSWLKVILDTFQPTEASGKDSRRFRLLLKPLQELLRELYYYDSPNPGHLLYDLEFQWAKWQPAQIRSLYIARICRALGLLGCNIRAPDFREEILGIFRSLKRNHNGFFDLYSSYICANCWKDIAKATRRSMQGSSLDEMVGLLQSDRIQSPIYEIFGVRNVTYSMTEEILSLLAGFPSQHLSSLQAPPFDISSGNDSMTGVSVDLEGENDHVDALNEVNEISADHDHEEDPDFIPRTDLPEVIYARHSEAEKKAATIIQRVYRRILEQRRLRNKPGQEGLNRHYFHLCWKRVREENRERDSYTQAFLGPLPHLLSSFDCAKSLAMAKQQEMTEQLVPGHKHESLDEISRNLKLIAALLIVIKECRQRLLPTADSSFHRDHDLDLLKKHISDGVVLLSDLSLPFKVTADLRTNVRLVRKALLQEKRTREVEVELPNTSKKKRLPELNMGDENDPGLDWGMDAEDD
ncbi:hypothetical protein BYT27DRAFT_7237858 [Phlegmacium glaucopus]|nr:hypothetical protein BYT27DRAFT_7237858 [Phlegmacium glaucopus]